MEILIYVIGTSVLKEINGGIHSKVVIYTFFLKTTVNIPKIYTFWTLFLIVYN